MTIRLTRRPITATAAYRELAGGTEGGVALFVGRVRPDRGPGGRVTHLFYESHVAPARAALALLDEAARRRFGARRTVLWHRLGRLPVGTASVIVGSAAAHRSEAFAACRFLIDRLKAEVPIWKTEERGPPARPRPARPSRRAAR